jgi:membrane protease YdiL (CAAX protease family)
VRVVWGEFVVEPLAGHIWAPSVASSVATQVPGNGPGALRALLVVWTLAALGEEIAYRGYLLLRAAELLGGSARAYWSAMALVSVLFGHGHYYKGPTGIVDSTFAGLVLGTVYLLAGRNLWASVLAHGLIDTIGVAALFFGVAS